MSFCSFSGTKVMECHFVHSAGLRLCNVILVQLLACQPRVTVTSCFVYNVLGNLNR